MLSATQVSASALMSSSDLGTQANEFAGDGFAQPRGGASDKNRMFMGCYKRGFQ
jgi:hypothetical protein